MKPKNNPLFEGFLLINKPKGITSYDVIRTIKKLIPPSKIGHAGTLDPFATGLLIIAIGKNYTKRLSSFLQKEKSYQAEITLGIETDSYDIDGAIIYKHQEIINFSLDDVTKVSNQYKGTILQKPPIFSAKKVNGVPAYKLARQGKKVSLSEKEVTIYELNINHYSNTPHPVINMFVRCSKGTYIRSLAQDIGKALNVGGHLSSLSRQSIGNISITSSIELDKLNSDNLTSHLIKTLPDENND